MRRGSNGNGKRVTKETIYFKSYEEDVVVSRKQDAKIPQKYKWLHTNFVYKMIASIVYMLATIFAFIYAKLVFQIRVENKEVLRESKDSGFILYGNHTQPVGDAFNPATYVAPKRIYTVAGPANLGIPVLGKLLPMLGALITPDSYDGMKQMLEAMEVHLQNGRCIVIYPEAHVWPWCTFIRPFSDTAFRFPVMFKVPCYCMTTTYQKPEYGRRPRITVYFDGPFYVNENAKAKSEQKRLHDEVQECMIQRSRKSNYEYIKYERKL